MTILDPAKEVIGESIFQTGTYRPAVRCAVIVSKERRALKAVCRRKVSPGPTCRAENKHAVKLHAQSAAERAVILHFRCFEERSGNYARGTGRKTRTAYSTNACYLPIGFKTEDELLHLIVVADEAATQSPVQFCVVRRRTQPTAVCQNARGRSGKGVSRICANIEAAPVAKGHHRRSLGVRGSRAEIGGECGGGADGGENGGDNDFFHLNPDDVRAEPQNQIAFREL